jgi:hypothetical protein
MHVNGRLIFQSFWLFVKIMIIFAVSNSSITNFVYQNF